MTITTLPPLRWTGDPGQVAYDGDTITLTSAANADWINDALGKPPQHNATALVFDAPESFALSARVTVPGPRTTYDAGVLCIFANQNHWAKLCFEFSPQGQAMVVSVVTNTLSDDCNSTVVTGDSVHFRVSRVGPGWAFHSSLDGVEWTFVRVFHLDTDVPVAVGFMAQAPTGDSCVATFDDIRLQESPPTNLRDGS